MIHAIITKANDDYWVRFKTYNTVEEIFSEVENRHHNIIIGHNLFYQEDVETILECWDKITLEEAEKISQTRYEVIIYNNYLE